MSKIFKIGFVLIIILGILLLCGVTVNATTIEVNSIEDLKEVFDSEKITVSGNTITITESTSVNADIKIKTGYYTIDFAENEMVFQLAGSIETEGGNITLKPQNETVWSTIKVPKGESLKIEGGTYFGDFQNYGTLEINGGTVVTGIGNYGELIITEGQVVLPNVGGALWNMCDSTDTTITGTLTIKGGRIGSLYVASDTVTKISGGEIETFDIYPKALVELTGGDFSQINLTEGEQYAESDIERYIALNYKAQYEEYNEENFIASYKKVKVASLHALNLIKKIAPDGKNATLKTVIPKNPEKAEFILSNVVDRMLNEDDYMAYAYPIDMNDLTVCKVGIQGEGFQMEYDIKVTYDKPEENQEVQSFINQIKDFDPIDENSYYQVKDLGLINYYMTSSKSELWNNGASARALRYSDEIIKLTNGGNIKYHLSVRAGSQDESFMYEYALGEMAVFYNDYAYHNQQQGIFLKRVIYIPENTADSKEAYIEAAQKRINDYLGKNDLVIVEYGGKLNDLEEEALDKSIPLNETDGNYYNITVKGKTYKFYILKGEANKLETPIYKGIDYGTNIKITSTDSNVPLDTSVNAIVVTSEQIEKALGTKIYKAYDIGLYSDGKGTSIEKLDNGKFLVSIPVPKELKDKTIVVYYINSAGEKEEHIVTVKDDIAEFETDHFSTYVLAEKINENANNINSNFDEKDDTPKTGCVNYSHFLWGIVSMLVLSFLTLKLKKL